jgi:hypothetical protein
VLKALVVEGGAGLAGGPVRLCVSVLVGRGFVVDEVGRVLGWRNTAEPTDPMVGVGLSRMRAERDEGAL